MDSRIVARKIAEEAIVLLKNESKLLPFSKGQRAAFFGRTQFDTIYFGNGSGAAHKTGCKNILEECEKSGICAEPGLKAYYREKVFSEEITKEDEFDWADTGKVITSGVMYEIFGKYHAPIEEYRIPDELMRAAGAHTDTAVLVLGRNSGGEECDRHLYGDYYLTDAEKELADRVCSTFRKVVLILNTNGLVDLSWVEAFQAVQSILFVGILGEEGASALSDILVGNVNPSGKLAFSYGILDGLLRQARQRKMRLVLLWFGLWKNGESMYVPAWMKKDSQKYFRAQKGTGERMNTISPFCDAAVEKDRAAFTKLMAHIREQDKGYGTVIAMQVENEIGLLGTERDYCGTAQERFAQEIPDELAEMYQVSGTWAEAFGEDAGEYFMAYAFASALERITSGGQQAYPLPCYTNAWLKQHPWYAGSYPSGGPVKEVHRIWKSAAPSLFALAPDIYVPYTAAVIEAYSYPGNPLFIPEVRKDAATASYCLYAFLKCHALCYSPFGIEDLGLQPEEVEKPQRRSWQP